MMPRGSPRLWIPPPASRAAHRRPGVSSVWETLKRMKFFADWERLNAFPGAKTIFLFRAARATSAASASPGSQHQRNIPAEGSSQGTMPRFFSLAETSNIAFESRLRRTSTVLAIAAIAEHLVNKLGRERPAAERGRDLEIDQPIDPFRFAAMKPQRAEADKVFEKLPIWITRSRPSKTRQARSRHARNRRRCRLR